MSGTERKLIPGTLHGTSLWRLCILYTLAPRFNTQENRREREGIDTAREKSQIFIDLVYVPKIYEYVLGSMKKTEVKYFMRVSSSLNARRRSGRGGRAKIHYVFCMEKFISLI